MCTLNWTRGGPLTARHSALRGYWGQEYPYRVRFFNENLLRVVWEGGQITNSVAYKRPPSICLRLCTKIFVLPTKKQWVTPYQSGSHFSQQNPLPK